MLPSLLLNPSSRGTIFSGNAFAKPLSGLRSAGLSAHPDSTARRRAHHPPRQSLEASHNLVTFCLLRTRHTDCKGLGMPFRRPSATSRTSAPQRRAAAFSLVELIAVMAIMVVMMSLLAPTLSNFGGTLGRKAAVTTLMNTFEQARVAALETGAEVTVIFRIRPFPEQDSIMVVRERLQWDDLPGTGPIQLTKWIELPEKTLLFSRSPLLKSITKPPSLPSSYTPPGELSKDTLAYLAFTPRGTVLTPAGSDLTLFVTEGARNQAGQELRMLGDGDVSPLERIALARYTGRARLDVTVFDTDQSSGLEAAQ